MSTTYPELDSLDDAVSQWKYAPTLLNGGAAPVIMTVNVSLMP